MSRGPIRRTSAGESLLFPESAGLDAAAPDASVSVLGRRGAVQDDFTAARGAGLPCSPPRGQDDSGYQIRVPPQPGVVLCGTCRAILNAHGPTGYHGGNPICDTCLLEGESQLGMLIALASLARIYAKFDREDGAAREIAAAQILAFARIYDRFARRFGPGRELNFEVGFVGGEINPEGG